MRLHLQLTALAIAVSTAFSAQTGKTSQVPDFTPEQLKNLRTKRTCGTPVPSKEWDEAFNKQVEAYKQNVLKGKAAITNYTIPVIVHVIHAGTPVGNLANLSQAQINSQITVLNQDFAGTGFNVSNLAATAFSTVGAANCNITFCMATKNALGQTLPEPGIDRISYVAMGWTNPASFSSVGAFQGYIDGTIKPATIWDPGQYFNIWLTDENVNAVGLLGYATFPAGAVLSGLPGGGTNSTDGIWVWSYCFGNLGTLSAPYNLGRTATHETGHWLGLRHIGGDANGNVNGDCTATDYCADTPPQKGGFASGQYGQNYGAPSYPLHANQCTPNDPNGDMFMNFMDYCDDNALYMFTPDQRTRMQTAMAPVTGGVYRQSLTASSASQCSNPATTPVAITLMQTNVCNTVGVITTTNNSTGNPIPTFSWSSNPSAGVTFSASSTSSNPSITFANAGVYTITCKATNTVGNNSSITTVTVDACDVGIAKNAILMSHISMFPNPSTGKVNIITTLPYSQTLEVSVLNALGQVVSSNKYNNVTNNSFSLDMTSFSGGVYFVTFNNGQEKVVKRLILNK